MALHGGDEDPSKTGHGKVGHRKGGSLMGRSKHLDDHRPPRKPFQGLPPAARARKSKTDGNDMPLRLGPFTKGQTGIPRIMNGRRAPTRHKQNTSSLAGFLRSRGGIT